MYIQTFKLFLNAPTCPLLWQPAPLPGNQVNTNIVKKYRFVKAKIAQNQEKIHKTKKNRLKNGSKLVAERIGLEPMDR